MYLTQMHPDFFSSKLFLKLSDEGNNNFLIIHSD